MVVAALIRDFRKVAVSGGLPRKARQYGVLESPRGPVASGVRRWAMVIPGPVGAQVPLCRYHVVEPSCVELDKTYEGVRLECGGLWNLARTGAMAPHSSLTRSRAMLIQLEVCTSPRGVGVGFGKVVWKGDWKGREAIGAP